MKVKIHLHGSLAKKLKRTSEDFIMLDVDNATQMFSGLRSQVKGFDQALRGLKHGIKVLCMDKNMEQAFGITEEVLKMGFPTTTDSIHIIPCIKGKGIEVALISFFAALGASGAVAAALATITIHLAIAVVLGAVARILAPSPDTSAGSANPDERASFIFNGAINTVVQGGSVPLVYGQSMTGSVVISAGVDVEDITT